MSIMLFYLCLTVARFLDFAFPISSHVNVLVAFAFPNFAFPNSSHVICFALALTVSAMARKTHCFTHPEYPASVGAESDPAYPASAGADEGRFQDGVDSVVADSKMGSSKKSTDSQPVFDWRMYFKTNANAAASEGTSNKDLKANKDVKAENVREATEEDKLKAKPNPKAKAKGGSKAADPKAKDKPDPKAKAKDGSKEADPKAKAKPDPKAKAKDGSNGHIGKRRLGQVTSAEEAAQFHSSEDEADLAALKAEATALRTKLKAAEAQSKKRQKLKLQDAKKNGGLQPEDAGKDGELQPEDAANGTKPTTTETPAEKPTGPDTQSAPAEKPTVPNTQSAPTVQRPPPPGSIKLEPEAEAAIEHAGGKVKKVKFNNSEYAARYARFMRNLTPAAPGEKTRKARCPAHLALKIKSSGGQSMEEYIGVFEDVDGDWAQFEIQIMKRQLKEEKEKTEKGWMTAAELLDKYKSQNVVNSIVANLKKNPRLWRPHPDAPQCEEAIQYWALDKETGEDTSTKSEEWGVRPLATGQSMLLDKNGASALLPQIGALSNPASSSSITPAALPGIEHGGSSDAGETEQEKVERRVREAAEKAQRMFAEKSRKAEEARIEKRPEKRRSGLQSSEGSFGFAERHRRCASLEDGHRELKGIHRAKK